MSADTTSHPPTASGLRGRGRTPRAGGRALAAAIARGRPATVGRLRARPELLGVLGIAAVLNLWGLSINGWANTYYAAAVRSMSASWHDFLFAALDRSGLMTVDKPPLSLWVQALSARVFGFHPLSLLVPQALMGVAAAGLLYDLTSRRFGRLAGFVAGLALATTPVAVAVSRHNNPDELLVLCCVAAAWCAIRALERRSTRWLVLSGICVGLGFEAKMGVALMVVPGIGAAYLWTAPRGGRLRALRQLLAGGGAMTVVGLAWPLLVTLTPAADRPWISGTSDNSIWSLILGYNGLGRLAGQSGGPQAVGGGTMFGGPTGPVRLLQSGLGDQAGWLLGFALIAGFGVLALSRLRPRDPHTGWLLVVGGAFVSSGLAFSFASGIFHPYYVSFLAPFTAALVGAGVGAGWGPAPASAGALDRQLSRLLLPLALAGGIVTELWVLGELDGSLSWARPLAIGVAGGCALLLVLRLAPRLRSAVVCVALVALLAAPATWAAETLGHPTGSTFPTGGPASAASGGPGAAGLGAPRAPGAPAGPGGLRGPGAPGGLGAPPGPAPGGPGATSGGPPGPGGFAGDSAGLRAAVQYADTHGGGTIGVSSQSSAASTILSSAANVAGLGGFSGRESSVTASWIASEVSSGRLRWIVADQGASFVAPGDTRTGSRQALAVVARTCPALTLTTSNGTKITMYDCKGRADAIRAAVRA